MKSIYLMVILIVMLVACSPAATPTQTTASATRTESPSTPSASALAPLTASSTATQGISPTFSPVPTSTALPTLRPGRALILTSLHMIDEQNGWGIDASEHIIHRTDGGWTWKDVTPRNGAYRNSGFFALDANAAWATPYQQACYTEGCPPGPTNAAVWHTSDGGNTWQEQSICLQSQDCNFDFDVPPEYYSPVAIHFADAQTGWLLITVLHLMFQDRYRLYQTMDGGAHWSPTMDSLGGPMVMSVTGLTFQDKRIGWMSTSQIDGASEPEAEWGIYQSMNAGLTWNQVPLPVPNPLPGDFAQNMVWCGDEGVSFAPPNSLGVTVHCRVYTTPPTAYDFYYHSADGGKQWISWPKTGDVDFINPLLGWRSAFHNGAYDIEQTRDGGQTWSKLKTRAWKGTLDFVNEQTGWAIAIGDSVTVLVHTTDGGQTWEEMKPVVTPSPPINGRPPNP